MKIELGPPGPFMAGVLAGTKALDALDVPGETTLGQQTAFFWLHVGTSMASADLVDADAQALFVEGAKTRAPSRGDEPEVDPRDRPAALCLCGCRIVYTGDGWQHDAAPWFWGDDHAPRPDADAQAAAQAWDLANPPDEDEDEDEDPDAVRRS